MEDGVEDVVEDRVEGVAEDVAEGVTLNCLLEMLHYVETKSWSDNDRSFKRCWKSPQPRRAVVVHLPDGFVPLSRN